MQIADIEEARREAATAISDRVVLYAKNNDITQGDIAEQVGISRPTMTRRMCCGDWSLNEMAALGELFGCGLSVLVTKPYEI